jgi:Integrase zinc binding domain
MFKKMRGAPAHWLVCPPLAFLWDINFMIHDALSHPVISPTLRAVHLNFQWPGIKSDIVISVQCCETCQWMKADLPPPHLLTPPDLYGPLQHVHVDLFGP